MAGEAVRDAAGAVEFGMGFGERGRHGNSIAEVRQRALFGERTRLGCCQRRPPSLTLTCGTCERARCFRRGRRKRQARRLRSPN
jgi:hypothetical protein